MKRLKSIRGVEVHETEGGEEVVYIRFQANGRQYREKVGPSKTNKYGRNETLAEARRLLDQRRVAIKQAALNGQRWQSRREKAETEKADAERQAAERDAARDLRRDLIFEAAYARFLEAPGGARIYSRPENIRFALKPLSRVFGGRYADEITKDDVRRYFYDRLQNRGAFADWPRQVSRRSPEVEVAWLSAMFNFLTAPRDEGGEERDLANPCIGYRAARGRRRGTKLERLSYRPKHAAVIPTSPDHLAAILDAAPEPKYRAAWALAFYTGARPESELCAVTHGDVTLSIDTAARFKAREAAAMGWVTFRTPKSEDAPRTVPLHPSAENELRAILVPRPGREAGETEAAYRDRLAAWAALPVFRRRRIGGAWNKSSYQKAWETTIAKAAETYPELAGMWFRDFRKATITAMRTAGTDRTVAARVAGHRADMSDHYTQATDPQAREAILRLPSLAAVHRGRTSEAQVAGSLGNPINRPASS
jgi:hypothetical protein